MDRYTLLAELPADRDEWVKVSDDQSVADIVNEILQSHYDNESLYNRIALFFNAATIPEICDNIYDFEIENIEYREEGRQVQRVKLPQGFLNRGFGDCKHFASFAGGVLSGITRLTGKKIDWCYRFVSYRLLQKEPYHVFVVVFTGGREIWIDATPGTEGKQPIWQYDEKVNSTIGAAEIENMPLYKQIAGAGSGVLDADMPVPEDLGVSPALLAPITFLQSVGILSPLGAFNEARYRFLMAVYSGQQRSLIENAVQSLITAEGTTVGNFFDDIFKGVQHAAAGMGMQVPRASFLIMVRMNAFGYANKLAKALEYTDTREKLEEIWWRLGGQPNVLRDVIAEGATKPAATAVEDQTGKLKELALAGGTYKDAQGHLHDINTGAALSGASIGIAPVVAAAVITSATVIVAAILPIIVKMLDKHTAQVPGLPIDPTTGLPVGYSSGGISSFIQSNPIVVAAIAAALGWYIYENY